MDDIPAVHNIHMLVHIGKELAKNRAAGKLLSMGFRDVRNQGVLLRGVNATVPDLLDLCFALQDQAMITPYYFYMCDMIPNSEHWRLSVAQAFNSFYHRSPVAKEDDPVLRRVGFPVEILPLAIMRPLSGSGSLLGSGRTNSDH